MKIICLFCGAPIALDVEPSNSIDDVRKLIEAKLRIPRTHQRLHLNGRWLRQVSKSLQVSGIQDGTELEIRQADPCCPKNSKVQQIRLSRSLTMVSRATGVVV